MSLVYINERKKEANELDLALPNGVCSAPTNPNYQNCCHESIINVVLLKILLFFCVSVETVSVDWYYPYVPASGISLYNFLCFVKKKSFLDFVEMFVLKLLGLMCSFLVPSIAFKQHANQNRRQF